jgi:hypothetical protein
MDTRMCYVEASSNQLKVKLLPLLQQVVVIAVYCRAGSLPCSAPAPAILASFAGKHNPVDAVLKQRDIEQKRGTSCLVVPVVAIVHPAGNSEW